MNPLHYNSSTDHLPNNFKFKISPSRFGTFVTKPFDWYRTEVLKEEGFTYSTSSVIGTIVHYIAEQVAKGKEHNKAFISSYINSFEETENYNKETVTDNIESISETLINDYVLHNIHNYNAVEKTVWTEVKNQYYISGTIDVIEGSSKNCIITDYKTYNSKTKPKYIQDNYKYQLLVLAYVLTKLDFNVTRIRTVNVNRYIDGGISEKTGKPLKCYPSEITVLTEEVNIHSISFISHLINLCVDSIEATKKYPELTHVIWHDPRLKI